MRPTSWVGKVTSLFSAIFAGICLTAASSYAEDKAGISQPLAGLSGLQLGLYEAGLEEFERRFRTRDGLGPQFNGNSCHSCHRKPSVGGSGPRYRSNFNFTRGNDLLELEGGPLLQEKAVHHELNELIPAAATDFSLRKPPPLYGLGLAEAIPDSQIAAVAAQNGGKVYSLKAAASSGLVRKIMLLA